MALTGDIPNCAVFDTLTPTASIMNPINYNNSLLAVFFKLYSPLFSKLSHINRTQTGEFYCNISSY